MPGIARVGDILGPGGVLTAPFSPDVFVNNRPAALIGIQYTAHPCCGAKGCPPAHCGGPTFDSVYGVYINGIPPVTKSGKGLCGHGVRTASDDVIISGGLGSSIGGFALGKVLG
jgi:hypothetical protein